ncbi:hypothetical protein KZ820_06585 [Sphingomonas sp. RRHST34]|uniref:Uncharacterized protein n=1 Tax=Sphingomonas citri TaxID=2862499 RepID=A0ABS7BLA8_9SPHN|nr:hypothetical protein [Sphingomonas citri]
MPKHALSSGVPIGNPPARVGAQDRVGGDVGHLGGHAANLSKARAFHSFDDHAGETQQSVLLSRGQTVARRSVEDAQTSDTCSCRRYDQWRTGVEADRAVTRDQRVVSAAWIELRVGDDQQIPARNLKAAESVLALHLRDFYADA